MDRKTLLFPTVVAAPNPSAKDEWFPVLCTITPGFLCVEQKVCKQRVFFIMIPLTHAQSNLAMSHKLIMV